MFIVLIKFLKSEVKLLKLKIPVINVNKKKPANFQGIKQHLLLADRENQ